MNLKSFSSGNSGRNIIGLFIEKQIKAAQMNMGTLWGGGRGSAGRSLPERESPPLASFDKFEFLTFLPNVKCQSDKEIKFWS